MQGVNDKNKGKNSGRNVPKQEADMPRLNVALSVTREKVAINNTSLATDDTISPPPEESVTRRRRRFPEGYSLGTRIAR